MNGRIVLNRQEMLDKLASELAQAESEIKQFIDAVSPDPKKNPESFGGDSLCRDAAGSIEVNDVPYHVLKKSYPPSKVDTSSTTSENNLEPIEKALRNRLVIAAPHNKNPGSWAETFNQLKIAYRQSIGYFSNRVIVRRINQLLRENLIVKQNSSINFKSDEDGNIIIDVSMFDIRISSLSNSITPEIDDIYLSGQISYQLLFKGNENSAKFELQTISFSNQLLHDLFFMPPSRTWTAQALLKQATYAPEDSVDTQPTSPEQTNLAQDPLVKYLSDHPNTCALLKGASDPQTLASKESGEPDYPPFLAIIEEFNSLGLAKNTNRALWVKYIIAFAIQDLFDENGDIKQTILPFLGFPIDSIDDNKKIKLLNNYIGQFFVNHHITKHAQHENFDCTLDIGRELSRLEKLDYDHIKSQYQELIATTSRLSLEENEIASQLEKKQTENFDLTSESIRESIINTKTFAASIYNFAEYQHARVTFSKKNSELQKADKKEFFNEVFLSVEHEHLTATNIDPLKLADALNLTKELLNDGSSTRISKYLQWINHIKELSPLLFNAMLAFANIIQLDDVRKRISSSIETNPIKLTRLQELLDETRPLEKRNVTLTTRILEETYRLITARPFYVFRYINYLNSIPQEYSSIKGKMNVLANEVLTSHQYKKIESILHHSGNSIFISLSSTAKKSCSLFCEQIKNIQFSSLNTDLQMSLVFLIEKATDILMSSSFEDRLLFEKNMKEYNDLISNLPSGLIEFKSIFDSFNKGVIDEINYVNKITILKNAIKTPTTNSVHQKTKPIIAAIIPKIEKDKKDSIRYSTENLNLAMDAAIDYALKPGGTTKSKFTFREESELSDATHKENFLNKINHLAEHSSVSAEVIQGLCSLGGITLIAGCIFLASALIVAPQIIAPLGFIVAVSVAATSGVGGTAAAAYGISNLLYQHVFHHPLRSSVENLAGTPSPMTRLIQT